jgi:hypothetical protein
MPPSEEPKAIQQVIGVARFAQSMPHLFINAQGTNLLAPYQCAEPSLTLPLACSVQRLVKQTPDPYHFSFSAF